MSTKKNSQSSTVRISVTESPQELNFETALSADEVKALVTQALSSGQPLMLTEIKGREIIVPAAKIGFVDISVTQERRVGFGAE